MDDIERRNVLAKYITRSRTYGSHAPYVNRIWAELMGRGFYMPVDDMGPERTAVHPDVLDLLSKRLVDSGYNVRWLFRTIANSETYQRTLASAPSDDSSVEATPFAGACRSI